MFYRALKQTCLKQCTALLASVHIKHRLKGLPSKPRVAGSILISVCRSNESINRSSVPKQMHIYVKVQLNRRRCQTGADPEGVRWGCLNPPFGKNDFIFMSILVNI